MNLVTQFIFGPAGFEPWTYGSRQNLYLRLSPIGYPPTDYCNMYKEKNMKPDAKAAFEHYLTLMPDGPDKANGQKLLAEVQ